MGIPFSILPLGLLDEDVELVEVFVPLEDGLGFLMAGVAHDTAIRAMHIATAASQVLDINFFIIACIL